MMLRSYWILFALLWLVLYWTDGEAGPYAEIGAGVNTNLFGAHYEHEWDDAGGIGFYSDVGYRHRFTDTTYFKLHWTHISQWDVGCPQDCDTGEGTVDHIGVVFGLEWE